VAPYIRDTMRDLNLDIICFQETILHDFSDAFLRKIDPSKDYLWDWILAQGKSGGVLTNLRNERFDVGRRAQGDFILQHSLWDKKLEKRWDILNVYGAAHDETNVVFLAELASFYSKCKDPYVIGGDFNILRVFSEKNKKFSPNRFSDVFNNIIQVNGPREITVGGVKYFGPTIKSTLPWGTLDRVLMSREWELLFPIVTGCLLPRELFVHNPIVISTQNCTLPSKREFRFELSWLNHPDFLALVEKIWREPTRDIRALDKVQFKLKKVKKYLKGWGFNPDSNRKKRKVQIQNELKDLEIIEENGSLSDDQIKSRIDLKVELFLILEEEELYWYKRSHANWLLKGDNNNEYFHTIANGKKRKQTISSMKCGDRTISGDVQLIKHATNYYRNLFGRGEGNNFEIDSSLWNAEELVTDLENTMLTQPFQEEEIKVPLFQIEKNKVAGHDGIPIEFYQQCWDIIRMDMLELFHEFYTGSLDIKRINYGVITLLPKVKVAEKIHQFRPICLLNCLYKS
jgi:hypothetical protein